MDAEEYSKRAGKFFNRQLPPIQVLTNASMGCAGEAGEFVDHIKKVAFHGHDLDTTHVVKELGDQLWYINYAIYALNLLGHTVTLSDVMQINIDKLEARYPNGFSPEASRNRAESKFTCPECGGTAHPRAMYSSRCVVCADKSLAIAVFGKPEAPAQ